MLPDGSGNFAADPAERAVRATVIAQPDAESAPGVTHLDRGLLHRLLGRRSYEFNEPCIDLYQG
jgi:hypothetical protein